MLKKSFKAKCKWQIKYIRLYCADTQIWNAFINFPPNSVSLSTAVTPVETVSTPLKCFCKCILMLVWFMGKISLLLYQTAILNSRQKGLQVQLQRNSKTQTMFNHIQNHLPSGSVILCKKVIKMVSSNHCKIFKHVIHAKSQVCTPLHLTLFNVSPKYLKGICVWKNNDVEEK